MLHKKSAIQNKAQNKLLWILSLTHVQLIFSFAHTINCVREDFVRFGSLLTMNLKNEEVDMKISKVNISFFWYRVHGNYPQLPQLLHCITKTTFSRWPLWKIRTTIVRVLVLISYEVFPIRLITWSDSYTINLRRKILVCLVFCVCYFIFVLFRPSH